MGAMLSLALPVVADAVVAPAPCDGARRDAWDRARAPDLARYCDLVAQAEAAVETDAKRATAAATEADRLAPGRARPLVLLARAAAREERSADAVELFRRARAIDPRAAADGASLFALATSLARTGAVGEARVAYRALVPEASALAPARRTRARIDAGLAILAEGPDSAAEAVSVLRAAATAPAPELAALADAALALALDRSGVRGEARARAVSAASGGALGASGRAAASRSEDGLALAALLAEDTNAPRAIAAWEAFLASAGASPWAAHARAHVAELKKAPAPRGRR